MKRSILIIGTMLAFATGAIFFTSCGSQSNHDDDSAENAELHEEADHDDGAVAEATHVCPMHADITGLEGDKCSKCGMDLVAASDDDKGEHSDLATTHACPMHPEEAGLEGDSCSKCGMALTLAEAGEEGELHQ
jgi:hypothetical protein